METRSRGTGGGERKEREKQKERHSAPLTALYIFLLDTSSRSPNHEGKDEV